ncbi:metallophosphoesterase [Marinobacter sp. NFXS9]
MSDLHAVVNTDYSDDTHLVFKSDSSEFADALLDYIKDLNEDFDLLVCPGDIANKAQPGSFLQGWKTLNKFAEELKIPELICVPGNHDHESRRNEGVFDPKHKLQFCEPRFPRNNFDECTHFWAWHWCPIINEDYNAVIINSSAYHGFYDENDHGRVAIEVSKQIGDFIKSDKFQEKPINFLLCHHHPSRMDYVDEDYDFEVMDGAAQLIRKIEDSDKGPWMIIHGHKHFPEIRYSQSQSVEPIVALSAGSVSAKLHPALMNKTSNQFYIISVDIEKTEKYGKAIGEFETHEWTLKEGWHPSKSENLPAKGGFGSPSSPQEIANQIKNLFASKSEPFLEQSDLSGISSDIAYLSPTDFKRLISKLEKIGFATETVGSEIIQVGKS